MGDLEGILKEIRKAEIRNEMAVREAEREAKRRVMEAEREVKRMVVRTKRFAVSRGEKFLKDVKRQIGLEKRKVDSQTEREIERLRKVFEERRERGVKAVIEILSEV